MKTLILGISALSLIVMACDKEEVTSINVDENMHSSNENQIISEPERPGNDFEGERAAGRIYYDYGGMDYGCLSYSVSNCGATTVVTTSSVADFEDIFDAVESGVFNDIYSEFNTYYVLLTANIPSINIDKVLNQTYTVRARGIGEFDLGNIEYLVFEEGNDIKYVHPYQAP